MADGTRGSSESAHHLTRQLVAGWLSADKDHAVIVMDAQGQVLSWLAGAEEILGYSEAEVVGQPLARIFTPEDRDRGFDSYELEVARADSRSADERWHLRKDGTRIWASGTVTALRDANGALTGYVKVMRDRTDLRTHVDALENQISSLQSAKEQTHLFLRTLGHELRNPLSPLSNALHLLNRLAEDEKVRALLQLVDRQVAVIKRLANDLMDVTRMELGKLPLQLQQVDLRHVLRDAVESLQKPASNAQLKLQLLLPDAPLVLDADPERLQQVVLNLLSNAFKYTPAGGSIWLKATQDDGELMFRVQDTGIGIPPEMLQRIFDLFAQEPQAEQLAPGGLGVGLALVRELVELHGGTVQALSAGRGKGAEFIVRLPRRGASS